MKDTQPSLFVPDQYGGALARATDPQTSKDAAEAIRGELAELHRWTVECVTKSPGLTQAELAEIYCATDPRRIGRRLSELVKLGLLRVGETRKCTRTGRAAQTWRLVEAAS